MVAVALTFWCWWRFRALENVPFYLVAWLWPVWVLALPYAHFPDEIVLAPAILVALGHNGRGMTKVGPAGCVYLLFFSTVLYAVELDRAQMLWIPLLAIAVYMFRMSSKSIRALHSQAGPRLSELSLQEQKLGRSSTAGAMLSDTTMVYVARSEHDLAYSIAETHGLRRE